MDRRHAAASTLALILCLALLGRWALHNASDEPADRTATHSQPTPAAPTTTDQAATSVAAPAASEVSASNEPPESGIFRGRVIDAVTREPVREYELEFFPALRPRDSAKPPFQSFKTKDGRVEYRGLAAGVWSILATARGYQRFEINDVTISSDSATQEMLIPMRPGYALHGRVFDESSNVGIAAANISFREAHVGRYAGDLRHRPSTSSRKNGAFTLDGLPAGPIVVTVAADNYGPRELDIVVSDKLAPVEIALSSGGTIAGYLAGADGLTPVVGSISLSNLDENNASTRRTGTAGEFKFSRLAPARYRLSGHASGLSGEYEFTIVHNEQLEGIVLALRAGHSISGVVSGLSPEELEETTVSVSREGEFEVSIDTAVDERGAYTLRGVPPGRVRVAANVSQDRNLGKVVTMPADADLTLNLEFPRGSRLTGRVTHGGKPLKGAWVAPGQVAPVEQRELFIYGVSSSDNGDYVIENMPDGEYTLRVDTYRSPTVRLSGDTVFDVDIPAAQLSGRLLEAGGKVPVVGAMVDVWPAQPGASHPRLSARSDHFGQFAVSGLQPGDFVLSVYKPGFELYRGPLAFGSPISDMVLNLRPARGIEIKVRDASNGRALSNVIATELIDGQTGIFMEMNLDQNGVGYLPSAITGSSLRFFALGYAPTIISSWNGEGLDVRLKRQPSP